MEDGLHPAAPPGPPDWLWVMSFPCANPGPGPGGQRWPLPAPPGSARADRAQVPAGTAPMAPCQWRSAATAGAAEELHRDVLCSSLRICNQFGAIEDGFLLQTQAMWGILRGLFNHMLHYF